MPGGRKSNRKREEALAALLSTTSIEKAAQKAGLSERTLHNWLADPEFLGAYRDARRQVVEGAVTRLQKAAGAAVRCLKRNLTCGNAGAEIRAALGILDHAVKAVEVMDLAQQLAELKREIEEVRRHGVSDPAAGGDPAAEEPAGADGAESAAAAVAGGPGANPLGGRDATGPVAG